MRKGLHQGPLGAAIAWGDKMDFYSSGILRAEDTSYCADGLNHAVSLVGYIPGSYASYSVTREEVQQCRVKREDDKNGCQKAGEYVVMGRYCCMDVEMDVERSDAHWIVQNSHGQSWGESGRFRVKVSEGKGFCQINEHVIQPTVRIGDKARPE